MKHSNATLLKLALAGIFIPVILAIAAEPTASVSSDEALKKLTDGNARFVKAKRTPLNGAQLVSRRSGLSKDQHPFAVIVSCSDSRVPPELVFDQGLGDIFVVRTAGEVVDAIALGSIEYSVAHLGSPLIVVMGHKRCGAVAAAVSNASETGHIPDVLKAIQPAVDETKGKSGDAVDNAVRAQVLDVVKQLKAAVPTLSEGAQSGKLMIVGAYYDLDTGKVEFLKP